MSEEEKKKEEEDFDIQLAKNWEDIGGIGHG